MRSASIAFTCNDLPWKFEAGTPAITEAVGLGAAVDYLSALGMERVRGPRTGADGICAVRAWPAVPDLTLYGPPADRRGGVCSFTLGDIHAHDLATILDNSGIDVRAGHHCAQPLMERYQIPATARASFYVYTTKADIDCAGRGAAAGTPNLRAVNRETVGRYRHGSMRVTAMDDLYRQYILDHFREPRNYGSLWTMPISMPPTRIRSAVIASPSTWRSRMDESARSALTAEAARSARRRPLC